ncbi:hypothetical protein ABOONEI_811 [Aciduliprofundum boonei T469]|nr:hypothetical protein ABOONEI_811 [Aciduliprofundum boonei T469]
MLPKLDKRYRITFLMLLFILLLSITIRFPYLYYSHEAGADSFFYHRMSNVLLTFHKATWFLHPLSLWGLYPYSDSPAAPFYVAEFSSLSGLSVENSIIFYDYIFVIIGILGAFLLGLKVKRSLIFASFLAIAISLAPKAFYPILFSLNERVALVLMLPLWFLLIYFVISSHEKSKSIRVKRWSILIMYSFVASTVHLMFVFSIAFISGYIFYIVIYKLIGKFLPHTFSKVRNFRPIVIIILFLLLFYSLFFLSNYINIYGFNIELYKKTALFSGTDPFTIALNIFVSISGGVGILFPIFGVVGAVYLIFKRKLDTFEMWLIIALLSLTPFIINRLYIRPFLVSILGILIAYGAFYVVSKTPKIFKNNHISKRRALKYSFITIFIVSIVLGGAFAGYMTHHWDTQVESTASKIPHGMTEQSYNAAIWMKHSLNIEDIYVTNNEVVGGRVEAYSNRVMIPGIYDTDLDNLVFYNLYNNESELGITFNKWLNRNPFTNSKKWREFASEYTKLMGVPYSHSTKLLKKYNVSYFLYFRKYGNMWSVWYDKKLSYSQFSKTATQKNYAIYKNEWYTLVYLEYK